jgi:hypothetical protein
MKTAEPVNDAAEQASQQFSGTPVRGTDVAAVLIDAERYSSDGQATRPRRARVATDPNLYDPITHAPSRRNTYPRTVVTNSGP